MKTTTSTPRHLPWDLQQVAAKVCWWLAPEAALEDRARFVAQVMTWGNWEDVVITRRVLGEGAFRAVLENPPPGVFDEKSWCYWHVVYGITPAPPLPRRKLA